MLQLHPHKPLLSALVVASPLQVLALALVLVLELALVPAVP
jgi:hypothetical protein